MKNQIENLCLGSWEEATGKCVNLVASETGITILLQTMGKTYRLHLPSTEGDLQTLKGQIIAIVKTDIPEKPFLIRKIADSAKTTTAAQTPVHVPTRM